MSLFIADAMVQADCS